MESLNTRFYRPMDDRLLAGVCSGLANGLGIDATLVRLLWVLVTLFGGSGLLAYLLAWVIMPDELGQRASLPVVLLVFVLGLPMLCGVFFVFMSMLGALVSAFVG